MVGKKVNHYVIEAELGQGGMGVVYRARDTKLERMVALKFLPALFSKDETAKARFVNEARAVSALDHPNVAVVHEIGETDEGEMFIAMALYEGRTLEDIIADGALELDDAVRYGLDIARGLAAAHDKGIIHRDIKPGNIMVTDSGFLKILDFGLAKVQDVTMTMAVMSLGTLAYMSPEQARGTEVDHRTDLWALGVVIYEMLCGKRPFEGPYDAAILYAAANTDHERVSNRRTDAPDQLASIVDKLLQKSSDDRYQDAHELVTDLESMRAPTPSVIQPAPAPEEAGGPGGDEEATQSGIGPGVDASTRNIWKRPAVWIGAGALVIAGVGGSMFLMNGGLGGGDPVGNPNARAQAQELHQSGIDRLENDEYQLAAQDMERALQVDSMYVPAMVSLAGLYYQLGDRARTVRVARKAIQMDSTLSSAWYNLGLALADQGDLPAAIEALSIAVRHDSLFARAYSAWGDILIEAGRPDDALDVLESGLEKTAASSRFRFLLYKNQGKAMYAKGEYTEAIEYLTASRTLQGNFPETLLLLARSYDAVQDPQLALPLWEEYLGLETDPTKRAVARQRLGQ